jgi:hypothetical protein
MSKGSLRGKVHVLVPTYLGQGYPDSSASGERRGFLIAFQELFRRRAFGAVLARNDSDFFELLPRLIGDGFAKVSVTQNHVGDVAPEIFRAT